MSDKLTIKDILTDIHARHGKLTPEIVREEARPEDSPIHSYVFNKDVEEAAEEFYLERAHRLIQSVRVIVHRDEGKPIMARAFPSVPGTEDRYVYEPLAVVLTNEHLREQARQELLRQFNSISDALETFDLLSASVPNAKPVTKAKRAVRTAKRELEKAA